MAIEFKKAPGGGAEQLEAVEATAKEQVSSWWQAAERTPYYPCNTETVIEILQAVGYAVDRNVLASYVNGDVIPHPRAVGGHIEWNAIDIVHAQRALEARRRWKSDSLLHAHKFSMAEKMQAMANENGETTIFRDIDAFDIEGLLGLLVEMSADAGAVAVLAEAIRQKLKQAGVLS